MLQLSHDTYSFIQASATVLAKISLLQIFIYTINKTLTADPIVSTWPAGCGTGGLGCLCGVTGYLFPV